MSTRLIRRTNRRTRMAAAIGAVTLATGTLTAAFAEPALALETGRVAASPCLNFRSDPSGSARYIGCIPVNTIITIECTATGNAVTGPWGTTTLWDRTTYGGQTGFVSDAWVYTGTAKAVAGVCPPAPSTGRARGLTEPRNSADRGQCTWGAKEKFRQATGVYPWLIGDAKDWAASARNRGWTVVYDAQPRSIVVFQPGVQGAHRVNGHVAWVDSVERRRDGLYVHFTEMNGQAGLGKWNQRVAKDVAGMSYVLAP